MSPIKFILVIIILSQILSNGKVLPALADGFNVIKPAVMQAWQKQTVINENTNVVARFIGQMKARMVALALPKIERFVNIEKIVEDLHRLKRKVEGNV